MKKNMKLGFVFIAGILLMTGCVSTQSKSSGPEITSSTPIQSLGAPDWVVNGSGAFGGDQGKVFYGVGLADGIKNLSLLRSAADNRARSEISKVFQVYTESLMKDYMASTMGGDPNEVSEEQHIEQAIKTVSSMTLSGVEIVGHWQNPARGELYALARLDLNAFKDNLEKVRDLDKQVKEHIKENAEKLHKELADEVTKKAASK